MLALLPLFLVMGKMKLGSIMANFLQTLMIME